MSKEYAVYPFNYMRITQRHDEGNHLAHWYPATNYSDKPIDEAGKDGGKDSFAPLNDFVVEEILGVRNATTNTTRLKSVNKLYTPIKDTPDYLYITITHTDDCDLKGLKLGDIIKGGTLSKYIKEGTDAPASGNHMHITINFGKYYGFLKNTNGKWCMTYEKSLLPNEAFYVNTNHTKILNSKGYTFKEVPKNIYGTPVNRNENIEQIEVLGSVVRARKTASGEILGYMKQGLYNVLGAENKDGYDWYNVEKGIWFAYNDSWAKIYPKKVVIPEPTPEPIQEPNPSPTPEPISEPIEEPISEPVQNDNLFKKILDAILKFLNVIKDMLKKE